MARLPPCKVHGAHYTILLATLLTTTCSPQSQRRALSRVATKGSDGEAGKCVIRDLNGSFLSVLAAPTEPIDPFRVLPHTHTHTHRLHIISLYRAVFVGSSLHCFHGNRMQNYSVCSQCLVRDYIFDLCRKYERVDTHMITVINLSVFAR
jgi:hypothetical protein